MTIASVAAGATTLPTTASAAEVGAPCVREELRVPSGSWQRIDVSDADPSGRFQIAYGTDTSGRAHLIRWDNGVPANLGTPPGALAEVNQQGDIVGTTFSDEPDRSMAWRYSEGRLATLPGLPDSVEAVAQAIAPDGTVAGWVESADNQRTAVTWSADNSVQALPGSGGSFAIDIDVDGTVIGYLAGAPVRWAPGAEAEVLPAYKAGAGTSWHLIAISAGTVIGQEWQTHTDNRLVVWAPAAAPVSLGDVYGHAVNARGSIAYERAYENEQWLRKDGVDRSLPFGPSPFSIADIAALTDDDIAYGTHYSTPVRWVCA